MQEKRNIMPFKTSPKKTYVSYNVFDETGALKESGLKKAYADKKAADNEGWFTIKVEKTRTVFKTTYAPEAGM